MAEYVTSGSVTYSGKTFTCGDTVYYTSYSTTLSGGAGSNSGYTMPWHGVITRLYTSSYTNPIYITTPYDAAGTRASTMLTRPSWCTKGYKVTVTYNKNGGSSGTSSQTGYVGASLTGTASRTGYTFAGWYTAASGGSKVTTIPTSGTTYYAHWTANKYTVTLNMQSGSGGTASVSATYGSAMPSITKPTRTGYIFGGYYTGTNGSGTQYYTAAGASARTMGNAGAMTLYAKWTPITYSISFDSNDTSTIIASGTMSDQILTYDTASNLTKNLYDRGITYAFTGWNTLANGTGTSYNDEESVINLSSTDGAVITLYAQWDLQYISPSIDPNSIASKRYAYNESTSSYVEDDVGTFLHLEFDWSVDTSTPTDAGDVNYATNITIERKVSSSSTWDTVASITPTQGTTSDSFSQTFPSPTFDVDNTYDIKISISDYYGTKIGIPAPQASAQDILSLAFFTIDLGVGGKRIGMGAPAPKNHDGLQIGFNTEFTTSIDSTIKYDDNEEEYYDGLNDDSLLSPDTISRIEDILELPPSSWDYDPWWADPDSDVSLQNVLEFIASQTVTRTTFTPTTGSNYSDYGNCFYEVKGNEVRVHLGINFGSTGGRTVYNLPEAIRPKERSFGSGTGGGQGLLANVEIRTDGNVYVSTNGNYAGVDVYYYI